MCRRRNQRTRTSGKGVIKPPPAEHFRQAEYFDLAPIIERYVKAAGQFAAWIWAEINALSAELINEITTKAMELKLWHDENVGTPDWFDRGLRDPPPGWNGRLWRAGQRRDRYAHAHAGSESGRSTSRGHRAREGRRLDAVAVILR
jgi:hypothetical protein